MECSYIPVCNGGVQPNSAQQNQPKYLGGKFYEEETFQRKMEGSNPHLTTFDLMQGGMCPLFLSGLSRIPTTAEHYVDHLGFTSCQRNTAVVQLIQTKLIQPAVSQRLPTTVADRS